MNERATNAEFFIFTSEAIVRNIPVIVLNISTGIENFCGLTFGVPAL